MIAAVDDDHGEGRLMSSEQLMKYQGAHNYVLNSIGARIVSGELPAYAVINLNSLEEEYQVSRTVIREVVRVLESHGMLVSRRRVGITVQPIEHWDVMDESVIRWRLNGPDSERQILELMELRLAIEPVAARFAAERATEEERLRLVELARTLDELGVLKEGNTEEFLEADIAFHSLLIEASKSPLLICLVGPVTEVISGRWVRNTLSGIPQAGTLERHLAIADAVMAGDAEAAAASSTDLVDIIFNEISMTSQ